MFCLNPIFKNPMLGALVAGCSVMLYFIMMSYSPNLPPAVLCSLAVGYFVYFIMGGKILCDDQKTSETPEPETPGPSTKVTETSNASAPTLETNPNGIATLSMANNY